METSVLLVRLQEMERTLTQPVVTEEDRDSILSSMRTQIRELKCLVSPPDESHVTQYASGTGNEEPLLHHSPMVLNNWKICKCKESYCETCEAEKEAKESALIWMNYHGDTVHTEGLVSEDVTERHHMESHYPMAKTTQMPETTARSGESSSRTLNEDLDEPADDEDGYYEEEYVYFADPYEDEYYDENRINRSTFGNIRNTESGVAETSSSLQRPDRYSFNEETCSLSPTSTLQTSRMPGIDGTRTQRQRFLITMTSDRPSNFAVSCSFRQVGTPREVSCIVDHSFHDTGLTSKYIIRLCHTLSTSGYGDRGEPLACGLVALFFANTMRAVTRSRIVMTTNGKDVLPYNVYRSVEGSISYGVDLYTTNCGESCKLLGPQDILILFSSVGVELKDQQELDHNIIETFANALMVLEPGMILLFFRMEEYNVLSAIRRRATDDIILFDSQAHTVMDKSTNQPTEHGAFIYHILERELGVVKRTLKLVEKYGGKMTGHCTMAWFKTKY